MKCSAVLLASVSRVVPKSEGSWTPSGPQAYGARPSEDLLAEHGFVQTANESFAETVARSLDIGTDELRVCIAQGRIGSALLERFGGLSTFR
jgi:hypothetical protein